MSIYDWLRRRMTAKLKCSGQITEELRCDDCTHFTVVFCEQEDGHQGPCEGMGRQWINNGQYLRRKQAS